MAKKKETEPQFIPCTSRELPDELLEAAAATAIVENPANRPDDRLATIAGVDRISLAILTTKWWGSKGVKLPTSFMDNPGTELQNKILSYLNQWYQYCNAEFVLSNVDPIIRIARNEQAYYSYMGTDCKHIPTSEHTMMLGGFTMNTADSEFNRVVPHEGWHALGGPHEHSLRAIVKRIDRFKAIRYFNRTQGWSPREVEAQVLTSLEDTMPPGTLLATEADEDSVMCYWLPGEIMLDGKPVLGGKGLSIRDKEFCAKVYPKAVVDGNPTTPPIITGLLGMTVDFNTKVIKLRVPKGFTGEVTKE